MTEIRLYGILWKPGRQYVSRMTACFSFNVGSIIGRGAYGDLYLRAPKAVRCEVESTMATPDSLSSRARTAPGRGKQSWFSCAAYWLVSRFLEE